MPIFLTVAVLVVANVLNNRLAPGLYLPTCLTTTAVLVLIARRSGLTWSDLGLGADSVRRGARWGLVLTGTVAAVYLLALALPFTREAFLDERARDLSAGQLLWQVLLRVPFGTVLLEEGAFRGVLWAMIERRRGTTWATAVSSALFGLWHVLPSLGITSSNAAAEAVFGRGTIGTALSVLAAVLGTAAAGVILCELRRRSGSLLAPAALHWAVNGLGYTLAWTSGHLWNDG